MKFSEMKLQVTNAVRAYFHRNWTMEDLTDSGLIPQPAYNILTMIEESRFFYFVISLLITAAWNRFILQFLVVQVYLTLFYAMLSFTFGSYLHLTWEAGGPFTVLSSVASLLCLYFTSPLRVRTRVSLLMYAACTSGASFGLFTKYLFKINQVLIGRLLEDSTLGIGIIYFGSLLTRERRVIYLGCLSLSCFLIVYSFVANALGSLDSNTAHWVLKVYSVQALFMGYFVIYSQEILYDARLGEVNFVNRTLTAFLHLPALVIHAARLYLTAEIERHRQY